MLDLKLLRDLRNMKGQMTAVVLVMTCGLTMMIMARGLVVTLETTERNYYTSSRFADLFCDLKRAPRFVETRLGEISGVAALETSVKGTVVLDLPGMKQPADGVIHSLPDGRPRRLNRLVLKAGRLPGTDSRDEVVVSAGFADAHGFRPGDPLDFTVYGVRRRFRIVGVAVSPEYVYETRPGEMLPDPRRFAVLWMGERELSRALDLDGAFNSVAFRLAPGADPENIKAAVDRILEPYGGLSSYDRTQHPSAKLLRDEITQLRGFSIAFPAVFLSIAAFMVSAVLTRLVRLQREQIAQMKALGYSPFAVGFHYVKFALVAVGVATLLSATLGMWAGSAFVSLYRRFFQFPSLQFVPDWRALAAALGASALTSVLGVLGAVRQAASLPPAEAMRPEAPARFTPTFLERIGLHGLVPPSFRMALRNMERKPWQALFTAVGLAFATAIPILPGVMGDGVDYLVDFQWNRAQRQDAVVSLIEPGDNGAFLSLSRLPGVLFAEPFRAVPVRLLHGHRQWETAITGLPASPRLNRLLDEREREVPLPSFGLLLSEKLAELLHLVPGDEVRVEVREGRRPVLHTVVSGTIMDFSGVSAYMEINALRRLLGEGDTVNGAYLKVDPFYWDAFWKQVKAIPRIGTVTTTSGAKENFSRTTEEMMGTSQALYFVFAVIVSFGVIYNGARIALSERARDLATLRVLGFTRREVATILVLELALLTALSIAPGLYLGARLSEAVLATANTETMRFPLVLTIRTYVVAVLTVLTSSFFSFVVVGRRVARLDLLAVLKSAE
jgi:putative ABC transport system permease protein